MELVQNPSSKIPKTTNTTYLDGRRHGRRRGDGHDGDHCLRDGHDLCGIRHHGP